MRNVHTLTQNFANTRVYIHVFIKISMTNLKKKCADFCIYTIVNQNICVYFLKLFNVSEGALL